MRPECSAGKVARAWLGPLVSKACSFAADRQGSAAIETVLAVTVLVTLMLGIIEFSMMTYTYAVYSDAARRGVRYAVVHGVDSTLCSGPSTGCGDFTAANVVNAVTNAVSGLSTQATSLNVSVAYPDNSCAPASRVIVTVSYTYKPVTQLTGLNRTFTTTSAGAIQY